MKCPNCRKQLTFIDAIESKPEWFVSLDKQTADGDAIEIRYSCKNCTYDYKIEAIFSPDTKLFPICWG